MLVSFVTDATNSQFQPKRGMGLHNVDWLICGILGRDEYVGYLQFEFYYYLWPQGAQEAIMTVPGS